MALNVTQVNQAFLGLLGRPATGAEAVKFAGSLDTAALAATLLSDASFKSQLSVDALSFKTVDLLNADPAAFVESLYTALLGRASDAEGKAFWLSVAGITPNRADVVSQFIAAVQAQEGTADANAFASIQAEDKALAAAWVESLYNNLAGRASDAEGLDFWTNAIVSFTMTPAQVAASFAAALALQGNTTEDGQNFAAKVGVADAFTASFKDFSTLITSNEKSAALKNLVTMMNGVNKDSQVDQYTQEVTKFSDEYQNLKAIQFTTKDDDNLGIDPETGESNLNGTANFTGTYNLTDPTKGTIQSSDSATGTEAYLTDTLTINVTGYDKTTHDTFDLAELPSTTSVEKLVINNGAASVNGSVNGDFQYINVNGTGSFNITATTSNTDGFKDISLNSAANKDGVNTFATTQTVQSIKTGAGNDSIAAGIVTKSLNTGAGDDDVAATLSKGATADLGAGDDKFTGSLGESSKIQAGAGDDVVTITSAWSNTDKKGNPISNIEIDLGTGDDKLDLSNAVDFTGISSIKGTETIKVGTFTTLVASAVSGQKIALEGNSLVLDASTANNVDLSKFTNLDGNDVKVTIGNVKAGTINLETGDKNFNAIKETIVLAKDAGKVTIKGFEQGNDHIEIAGAKVNTDEFFTKTLGTTTGIDTAKVLADNIYFVNLKEKVTKAEINKLLANNNDKFNIAEKGVFYIVATDSEAAGGDGKSSAAKVYKIEVGKDGTVAKLDQTSSITVANKGVLNATDFNTSATYTQVESVTQDAASGTVTVAVTADPAAKTVEIDLSGVQNADKLTTLTINGVTDGKDVILKGLPNNATPVTVNFEANAQLGAITTEGGSANVTLGANNTATTISLGGLNDKLTLNDGTDYTSITSIIGAETIDGGNGTGAKINLSALPSVNNKLAQFNLENKLVVVTAEGDKTVDASSIRDISTELIIDAEAVSGEATFIGSTTHISGGKIDANNKEPFVSVNVKDITITNDAKYLKDVNIAASGSASVTESQIKEGGNLATTNFKGSGSLTVNADGKNAVDLSGTNFTVANATIAASGDVTAAITGLSSGATTLALGANKGITASGSLTDIDVVKLSGTNNIADTKLAAFGSNTKIEATANDKVTTTTTGALDLSTLDKQGTVTPVINITVAADTHTVSGSTNLTENLYLGDGTGTWNTADLTKYDNKVDAIYATATKLTFESVTKATHTKKLDLSNANSVIDITTAVSGATTLSDLFVSGDASDTISLKATQGSSAYNLTLTSAKDVVAIQATGDSGATIKAFTTGTDKIDLTTLSAELTGAKVTTVQAKVDSAANTLATDKVYTITAANDVTVASNITIGSNNGNLSATVEQNKSYLIAIKTNDGSKTAIYEAKSTDNSTLTTGEIKLVATVEADLTADTSWLA